MSGSDRFGYRPSREVTSDASNAPYNIRQTERQKLLDKIHYDQLERQWRSIRFEQGREGWHDFGNKELPIERYRHDIMKMIATNRISLLAGETGSGKSTQLAQYALEMGYDRIVYLQPRRVTTDAITERIEAELGGQFEERGIDMPEHLVGMAHSERSTLRPDSVIQVMTSAVFKKRAPELREQWQGERVLIVADEVHEGNIETEFAVATAAELMTERESWNMVLMSATLNEKEIQDAYTPINGKLIPSITVEGRPHNIEQYERPDKSVIDVFAEECFESGTKTLIFTDGKRSVNSIKEEIEGRYGTRVKVLVLHSKIDDDMRQEIFHGVDQPGVHTVIVSTSAGQSGLTIPGLDRVISDGWTKSPELDDENASGLPRRLCSRAELTQQMGRGGRDVAGAKFFLAAPIEGMSRRGMELGDFTSFCSPLREEHIPADIYHTVITRNVLSAAAMDRDFYTLNAYLIHKVTQGTIKEAYAVLQLMGSVDLANRATAIGKRMDMFPLRPELARALIEVLDKGTDAQQRQMAAITAAIEAGGLGGEKIEKRNERLSTETKDDFIAELDLFMGAAKYFNKEEADTEGLNLNGLDAPNAIRAYKQFNKICMRAGIAYDDEHVLTNTLTATERTQLHEFFLTGMPHLIYEEVRRHVNRGRRKVNRQGEKEDNQPFVWFRNLLGPERGKEYGFDRQIGKRSVMAAMYLPRESIIAGYPRWYENHDGDTVSIIDKGFLTSRAAVRRVLGRQALEVRRITQIGPDGRLQLVTASFIGRLRTSKTKATDRADSLDKATLLAEYVTDKAGPALKELRQLKRWLEDLNQRVPKKQQNYYFDKELLSDHDLKGIVQRAAENAGSSGELDANIRALGITYVQYISPEKLKAIEENMPVEIEIGGSIYKLYYKGDEATPMIYEFPVTAADALPHKLTIRDGRQVLFRYTYSDGDARVLTAAQVKQMSRV